jgi:hypothetical protein
MLMLPMDNTAYNISSTFLTLDELQENGTPAGTWRGEERKWPWQENLVIFISTSLYRLYVLFSVNWYEKICVTKVEECNERV